jgi:hypothetical protein
MRDVMLCACAFAVLAQWVQRGSDVIHNMCVQAASMQPARHLMIKPLSLMTVHTQCMRLLLAELDWLVAGVRFGFQKSEWCKAPSQSNSRHFTEPSQQYT